MRGGRTIVVDASVSVGRGVRHCRSARTGAESGAELGAGSTRSSWVRRWRPGRLGGGAGGGAGVPSSSPIVTSTLLGDVDRAGDDRDRHQRDQRSAARRSRPRRTLIETIGAGDQQRDQVHHLDQRVDRRAGGVLERVADGVADDRWPRGPPSPCRRGCRPRPASWRCPRRHRSWPGRPPSGCRCRSRRPGSRPARSTPRPKPTAIGASTARMPGVTSSRSESLVTMSTTLPYSGRPVPSMIPGISRNWRRTSKTTAPAARPTALIARPEKRNTTAAPSSTPTSTAGLKTQEVERA